MKNNLNVSGEYTFDLESTEPLPSWLEELMALNVVHIEPPLQKKPSRLRYRHDGKISYIYQGETLILFADGRLDKKDPASAEATK